MFRVRDFEHDHSVVEAEAKQIIGKLRRYHRLGQPGDPRNLKSTVNMAGTGGPWYRHSIQVRAFARLYTRRELDALCSMRRLDGLPLNWASSSAKNRSESETEWSVAQETHERVGLGLGKQKDGVILCLRRKDARTNIKRCYHRARAQSNFYYAALR